MVFPRRGSRESHHLGDGRLHFGNERGEDARSGGVFGALPECPCTHVHFLECLSRRGFPSFGLRLLGLSFPPIDGVRGAVESGDLFDGTPESRNVRFEEQRCRRVSAEGIQAFRSFPEIEERRVLCMRIILVFRRSGAFPVKCSDGVPPYVGEGAADTKKFQEARLPAGFSEGVKMIVERHHRLPEFARIAAALPLRGFRGDRGPLMIFLPALNVRKSEIEYSKEGSLAPVNAECFDVAVGDPYGSLKRFGERTVFAMSRRCLHRALCGRQIRFRSPGGFSPCLFHELFAPQFPLPHMARSDVMGLEHPLHGTADFMSCRFHLGQNGEDFLCRSVFIRSVLIGCAPVFRRGGIGCGCNG